MGVTGSKAERSEALRLCKERKRFIKQAIDSRYDFAAAHVAYTRSLRNIGVSLRRFAEAEVLLETPSHSSYPSPAPSQIGGGGGGGVSDSPLPNDSPLSPQPVSRLSYMRSSGTTAVTVSVKPSKNLLDNTSLYVDDGEFKSFSMPPPPPPPLPGSSWDYFDPIDEVESFRFVGHEGYHVNFDDMSVYKQVREKDGNLDGYFTPESEKNVPNGNEIGRCEKVVDNEVRNVEKSQDESCSELGGTSIRKAVSLGGTSISKVALEQAVTKNDKPLAERDSIGEREDPSEFITHRAKDFLSSIRDIENRFFRASESGREVSRMLEANKIHVGFSGPKGNSHRSNVLGTFRLNCCRGKTALVSHEPAHVTKVITWKRSTSSRSSSSRNPLTTASKDESDDSGSDFIEEFCMIAGSHSSTLDRLYAWERKLYDEVKASESIRKEYDRKCSQLRHQFAKDLRTHVIDKTRAVVKDLHSRIRVALHAVDSISKRIEKMRDEELQPQLVELIQGLIRMWKAMLECHHAQYITISLAYHAKRSNVTTTLEDTKKQIVAQLQHEVECFGLSFADMVNSLTSYVEALNGWLHNRNLQQRERIRGRSALSPPRRVLTPPIFVLCREWTSGIQSLPSEELSGAISAFLCDLSNSVEQETEQLLKKQKPEDAAENGEAAENKGEEKNDDHNGSSSNLNSMQQNLGKVLDRLTKFSEASLKMYEDIRQKSETARNAYSNYRPPRSLSL